ncbi:hypothetical protein ABZ946_28735 [Streptomyces sp. NPDC046324]|uniref:hypothetical protein n=1 Tax=Streptomyces sp. NPDC046324 TaxID=3154915 RepID=UPI0033D5E22B
MRTRALPMAPPPGAARLARITVVPWIDRSSATGVRCRLLLVHDPLAPGETLSEVEADMLGLAAGLRLAPSLEESRYIGPVLYVRQGASAVGPLHRERLVYVPGRTLVLLNYGHADCLLRVPSPTSAWVAAVAAIRHVHIAVGLDPLPEDAAVRGAVAYTSRSAAVGRLWAGIGSVRI